MTDKPEPTRFLWWCLHKWEILTKYKASYRPLGADLRPESYVECGTSYDLQCKHCGAIKMVKA